MPETLLTNANEIPSPPQPEPEPQTVGNTLLESEPQLAEIGEADEENPSYAALKIFFFTPKRGDIAGTFCLLYEGKTGKELFKNFWVTRVEEQPSIQITQSWREFNRALSQMGPYDKVLGDKLLSAIPELITSADCVELFKNKENRSLLNSLKEKLRKTYERSTHYFLDLSCELQPLKRQDLVDAGILEGDQKEEAAEEAASKEDEKNFMGTLIQCLPVVDPVWGKPVSSLEPGDMLEVQFMYDVGASSLVQNFLKAARQPPIFPVESIEKHDDNKIYVYLTISGEIRGLLTLTKDLRLKTKLLQTKKSFRRIPWENIIFFSTLGIALVIILMVARYLFF